MTAQTPGPVAKLISDLICACEENPCRIAASAIAHDAEDARKDEALRTAREALEPFALLVEHADRAPVQRDSEPIWATNEVALTQGDARAARAAIAAIDEVLP